MRSRVVYSLEYLALLAVEHPERVSADDADRLLASEHMVPDPNLREQLRQKVRGVRVVNSPNQ
jgi:hypothetical protein